MGQATATKKPFDITAILALILLIATILLVDTIWCRLILISGLTTLILYYGLSQSLTKGHNPFWRLTNLTLVAIVPWIISGWMLLVVFVLTAAYNSIPSRITTSR
jgi:hypothetical protein